MKKQKRIDYPVFLSQSEISLLFACMQAYLFLSCRSDIVQNPDIKGVAKMNARLVHVNKKISEREKIMFDTEGREINYLLKQQLRNLRKKNESNV